MPTLKALLQDAHTLYSNMENGRYLTGINTALLTYLNIQVRSVKAPKLEALSTHAENNTLTTAMTELQNDEEVQQSIKLKTIVTILAHCIQVESEIETPEQAYFAANSLYATYMTEFQYIEGSQAFFKSVHDFLFEKLFFAKESVATSVKKTIHEQLEQAQQENKFLTTKLKASDHELQKVTQQLMQEKEKNQELEKRFPPLNSAATSKNPYRFHHQAQSDASTHTSMTEHVLRSHK